MKLKKSGLGGVGAGAALFVVGLGIIPLAYCQDTNPEHIGQHTTVNQQSALVANNNLDVSSAGGVGPAGNRTTINLNNLNNNNQGINSQGVQPSHSNHTATGDEQIRAIINADNAKRSQANDAHLSNYSTPTPTTPTPTTPAPTTGKRYPTGECNPDALAIGIQHFRYDDAKSSDLVKIGSRKLHRDAAASLRKMQADAKRDGVTLTVGSAFRSISYQQGIVNRKKGRGQTDKQIYSVSAPAGYSEHSTGYVVDFTPIESSFGNTRAYRWLKQNAHKYHWVQSFTEEVSQKSNVMVEPWHWRYEGTEEARQLFAPRSCYR